MILSAIIFCAGMYCGHVLSPWIDAKVCDFKKRYGDDDDDFQTDREIERYAAYLTDKDGRS